MKASRGERLQNAPTDTLQRPIGGQCIQCHRLPSWKAANIDHDR